jgi:hypothetical protein
MANQGLSSVNSNSQDDLKIMQEFNPKVTFFGALVHKADLVPVDQLISKIEVKKKDSTQHGESEIGVDDKIFSFCGVFLTYSRLQSQIVIHYKDGRFAGVLECFDQKFRNFYPEDSFHIFENQLYVYNPKETQIYVYGMNTGEKQTDFQNTLIKLEILQTFPIWRAAIDITGNKKKIVVLEQDCTLRVYSSEGHLLSEDDKSLWLKEYNRGSNSSLAISSLNFIVVQSPGQLVIYHPNGKVWRKKTLQRGIVPRVMLTPSDKLCVLSICNSV